MAYRKIHDDFWTDPDIEELTPEQKYFYLYLITNPSVNQIGLYELSIKRACFETGYNTDTVSKLLNTFEEMDKIKRSEKTREILVRKFYWHNKSNSPKVIKHVEGLLEEVKDTLLIQYIYGMGTASQEEEEKETKKKKLYTVDSDFEFSDNYTIDFKSFIDFFNEVTGSQCRMTPNKKPDIKKQLKTFTGTEIKQALVNRSKALKDSEYLTSWESIFTRKPERMEKYLNLKTSNLQKNGNQQTRTKGDEHVAFLTRHDR